MAGFPRTSLLHLLAVLSHVAESSKRLRLRSKQNDTASEACLAVRVSAPTYLLLALVGAKLDFVQFTTQTYALK